MDDTVNSGVAMINSISSRQQEKKSIRFGSFQVDLFQANLIFAFLAIAGQVGQKVSLPLWIDSTVHAFPNSTAYASSIGKSFQPRVDSYFVFSFSSLSFVIIFGVVLLFIRVFQSEQLGETERRFPHLQLFLVGMCNALNGVLIVFASSGSRTPTYLQAILGNFQIPLIMGFRFFILRRIPTRRKFVCAMVVLLSLFICLLPKMIRKIDPEAHDSSGGQNGSGSILWPLCFMFGLAPGALMNVVTEKGLKMVLTVSRSRVNLLFFLFWTSVYQFLVAVCLFWTDFLPQFGYADNIYHFWDNWSFGFKCFFGGAGCSSSSGIRGTIFIFMYTVTFVGGWNLVRFSEGATLLAIVSAVVTPLGFLFWTLFQEVPFQWHPAGHITTWFSIGGLVLMVPAIYFYNTGEEEKVAINVPAEKEALLPEKRARLETYSGEIHLSLSSTKANHLS